MRKSWFAEFFDMTLSEILSVPLIVFFCIYGIGAAMIAIAGFALAVGWPVVVILRICGVI